MSNYVSISASSLKSEELKVTIPGTTFKQSNILFGSGVSLCFANALSGISDVHTKNYSNFYLTDNVPLKNVLSEVQKSVKPKKISTTLQKGANNFVNVVPTSTFQYIDTQLELVFSTERPVANNQFTIELIDNKYCTISYDDDISLSYIVVTNGLCKLKRAPLIVSNEHYFRYILNGNNLVLLKDISGNTSIITNNAGKLSAVNFNQYVFNNILQNAITINTKINVDLPDFIDQQYINYVPDGVSISPDNKFTGISNNYLLCRNHTGDNLYDIMLLKNQTNEIGEVGTFNTLGLSGSNSITNYREYTSLNSNIDQLEDSVLSLNYVCYNQSFNIVPGINRFETSNTMFPFSVLNIADTTFIENGAFGSSTPKYADKVYRETVNNIGERATYLCTWLSYDSSTDKCLWLDRYYYPNLTTKEQTLTAAIYNSTFESYIEQLIKSNLGLKLGATENQYFDKLSDFTFEPSTSYVYDRVDIDNIEFLTTKNNINSPDGYYTQINENNGFTLGFYINQYTGPDTITLSSDFNIIEGGLRVEYTNETVRVDLTFYNSVDGYFTITSDAVNLPARSKNSIVCHVDSDKGEVKVFLNKTLIVDTTIEPLSYSIITYGDFFVEGTPIRDDTSYLTNIFLSLSPLPIEEVNLLVAKYNTIYNTYSISLPCGMRNRTDTIKHINTVKASSYSKANTFDIFLNGLEITSEEREELLQTIKEGLVDVMPLNATINNIEIL